MSLIAVGLVVMMWLVVVLVGFMVGRGAPSPAQADEWLTLDELADEALADIARERAWAEAQLRQVTRRPR